MSELLPCPGCGGRGDIEIGVTGFIAVMCQDSDCLWTGPSGDDEVTAIERWNTRSPSFPELVAALEEVLRYRRGEGKYRFTGLSDVERGDAMFDAWQEVEAQVVKALSALEVGGGSRG